MEFHSVIFCFKVIFLSKKRVQPSFCIMWHNNTEFLSGVSHSKVKPHGHCPCVWWGILSAPLAPNSPVRSSQSFHFILSQLRPRGVGGERGSYFPTHSSCSKNLCMCEFSSQRTSLLYYWLIRRKLYFYLILWSWGFSSEFWVFHTLLFFISYYRLSSSLEYDWDIFKAVDRWGAVVQRAKWQMTVNVCVWRGAFVSGCP